MCNVVLKHQNGSDRRRPIYLPFQLEDLNNLEFCKSVRLRSQESFGRQSSLRTTDSNQVLGIGAQDCGIYASAVCVHIKNGAPELRGSHTEGCLLVRCGFPDFVTVQKRTTYRRPLNALYTPTSAMEFRHGMPAMLSLQRILCLTQTKSVECRCRCQGDNLNAETFLKQKCEIAQPVFEDVLNRESNPESLISTTRINPLDH